MSKPSNEATKNAEFIMSLDYPENVVWKLATALDAFAAEAVAKEREACARAVEKSYRELPTRELDEQTATQARRQCAKLIRARAKAAK